MPVLLVLSDGIEIERFVLNTTTIRFRESCLWIWSGVSVNNLSGFLCCDSEVSRIDLQGEDFEKMAKILVLVVTLLFYIIAFGLALAAIEKRSQVCFSILYFTLVHFPLINGGIQFLRENQDEIGGLLLRHKSASTVDHHIWTKCRVCF